MFFDNIDTHKYPSYNQLLIAKKECYPDDINITEQEAIVPLQSLLDHISSRFLLYLNNNIEEGSDIIIYHKWGFDGSSGHPEYKQLFDDHSNSDYSVVITTIVPLKIVKAKDNSIIWENTTPSSTR